MNAKRKMSIVEIAVSVALTSFVVTMCSVVACRVIRKMIRRPEPVYIVNMNALTDRCVSEMISQDASEVFERSSNPKSSDTSDEE